MCVEWLFTCMCARAVNIRPFKQEKQSLKKVGVNLYNRDAF